MTDSHTQVSSGSILLEIENVWKKSRKASRDAAILVGGMLCKFIVARLREADGKSEAMRAAMNLTRESCMRYAAERLGLNLGRVWEMIRIAKVVELFGDPGELSYSSLRVFTVFVQRRPCKVTRGKKVKNEEVDPSESEVWEVKKDYNGSNPADVYRRAVENKWDSKYVREVANREIKVYKRSGPGPKNNSELMGLPSIQQLGRNSDPKDLADMVIEMIEACPRAEELKKLLIKRIQ